MTFFLILSLTAAATVTLVLVLIYHFSRPRGNQLSPLADGLEALRSVQTGPGPTP